jgi:hypothetical protein
LKQSLRPLHPCDSIINATFTATDAATSAAATCGILFRIVLVAVDPINIIMIIIATPNPMARAAGVNEGLDIKE